MTSTLLQLFLELHYLEPTIKNWSSLGDEITPRSVRKKMLDALFKAHHINCDYEAFKIGSFIDESFRVDVGKINQIYEKHRGISFDNPILQLKEDKNFTRQHAKMLFRSLFNYRLDLDKALKSDAGVLAASGYYLLPILTKQKLNQLIVEEVKLIDELLIFLINPLGHNYSKKDLCLFFQYPKIDLEELDLDWI
jgi:hypothetical protein